MTCIRCGKELDADALFCNNCGATVTPEAAPVKKRRPAPAKKTPKINSKQITLLAGVAVLVLVLVLCISLMTGKKDTLTLPTLYVQNRELQYEGKWQITQNMDRSTTDCVVLTPDGNGVFFYDKEEDLTSPVYYRSLKSEKKVPVLLDNDIDLDNNLYVSEDSETVIYLRNDGILFRHDLKNREKIATDVDAVHAMTADCQRVIFETNDGNLYIQREGKEKVLLAKEIDSFCGADEKCTEVYYISDKVLYKQDVDDTTGTKVDEDVIRMVKYYASGEMYYYKTEKETIDGTSGVRTIYQLFFYNGNKSLAIGNVYNLNNMKFAADAPVMAFTATTATSDVAKVYIAVEDAANEMQYKDKNFSTKFLAISDDGKVIYYVDNYSATSNTYNLYKQKISGKSLGKAKLYDTDVTANLDLTSDNTILYRKNSKNNRYDLYIDKKPVASEISAYLYYPEDEILVYVTDVESNGSATLNIWVNGKLKKTVEDVYDFQYCNNGKMLYLVDKDTEGKGDLFTYTNGKIKQSGSDVTSIIECVIGSTKTYK